MPVTKADCFTQAAVGIAVRNFHFGTMADAQTTASDQAEWEVEAGQSIQLAFRHSANIFSLIAEPDDILLQVFYETGSGTLVREIYNGPAVPDGTQFTFWATDDGTETGAPRCGTLRLYMSVFASGLTGYTVASDGTGNRVGGWSEGMIRANAVVQSIAHGGYPAQDRYALGPVDDELVTLTTHITPPYEARGHEQLAWRIFHDGTAIHTDPAHGVDGAGQSIVSLPTDSVFLSSFDTYGAGIEVDSNGQFEATSGPELWTKLSTQSPALINDGTTIYDNLLFAVDPRAFIDEVTPSSSIYNRGESASVDLVINNARGQALARDLDVAVIDSLGLSQATLTISGPDFHIDYMIPEDADAAHDHEGVQWTVKVIDPLVATAGSVPIFHVSSLLNVYVHVQLFDYLSPPALPVAQPVPAQELKIGTDIAYIWVHVSGVGDSAPPLQTDDGAIQLIIRDPGQVEQLNATMDAFSSPTNRHLSGWTPRIDYPAQTPEGDWTIDASVDHNGNSGEGTAPVSFLLTVKRELALLMAPPFDAEPLSEKRVLLSCERNGMIVASDTVPQWRMIHADLTTPDLVEVAAGTMDLCDGQTGLLYCADFHMPAAEGRFVLEVRTRVSGQLLTQADTFESRHPCIIHHPISFQFGPLAVPLEGESQC